MIRKIINNKLLVYILSRYLTYFIQFISSLLIANKLGPIYFGIWGFILLILNYFGLFNFGLSNSINVILVQNKQDKLLQSHYITNNIVLVAVLTSLISLICIIYCITGMDWFSTYKIKYEFILVCVIAILAHFNSNFFSIYRVYNDYFKIAFNQSIIPIILLIMVFFFDAGDLLYALISAYLIGNILSLIIYSKNIPFSLTRPFSLKLCLSILKKGWWLFLYNLCFYMILVSTRTLISNFYSIEDFGFFSFSFTLGDSVLLLFQAVSNIAFPKILAKLNHSDNIKSTIALINDTYITIVYLSVLIVCLLFPIIILIFPKYNACTNCMALVAITMAVYTRSFPYSSYLMSNNFEKKMFAISAISLFLNIIVAIFIIKMSVSYEYVILSTLISYYVFYVLCVNMCNGNQKEHLKIIDWRFLIPILLSIIISIIGMNLLHFFPIVLFILLNFKRIREAIHVIIKLFNNYKTLNI